MDALILADRIGYKARDINSEIPQCLIKIQDKSILLRQLEILVNHNVDKIYIVSGYKGYLIKEFLQKVNFQKDIQTVYNKDYDKTNTTVSVNCARKVLDGKPFLLLNGDVVFQSEILDKTLEIEGSVCPYETKTDAKNHILVIEDGRVKKIQEVNGVPQSSYESLIGIFKFNDPASSLFFNAIDQEIKEGNLNDTFKTAMNHIFDSEKFIPLDISGLNAIELKNYDDFQKAIKIFQPE